MAKEKVKLRLITGLNKRLTQRMVDIRELHGEERFEKGAEYLKEMLKVMELFEIHNMELRGLLGLRAKPWIE